MKSRHYLNWVKSLPCVCCKAPADDPHHIIAVGEGAMGSKASDFETLPLCRRHHNELHHDVREWERIWGAQEYHVRKTLLRAIFEGELKVNNGD